MFLYLVKKNLAPPKIHTYIITYLGKVILGTLLKSQKVNPNYRAGRSTPMVSDNFAG